MEWLAGFVLGVFADIFRSVFLPASTGWLNHFIPSARKKANFEENALTLEVMEKLVSLGKDPNLAKHARDDAEQFLNILTKQRDAFVDNAVEVIDSTHMSQVEMNAEAFRRSDVAGQQMERAVIALKCSGWLSEAQISGLDQAQAIWEQYAQSQAEFEALEYEGGSMAPLIHATTLENITLTRTGELKGIFETMRENYEG